ncbi:hypothetical protein CALCODRAFT_509046 [Calocera cornea HHB12733]|uniref:Pentacotripeptide-repeat region of PRORP domain-containing protein n=1 Tax=Calocera cornea HHB12733 TaxID=1353952 RepID=A0A165FR03_9BASI|nr:hypothetical protein CALCODRAFT_509046 [Calocera cornea HHB12733]
MGAKRLLYALPIRTATSRVRPSLSADYSSSLRDAAPQPVQYSHEDAVRSEAAENYARNGDLASAWREVRRMGECGQPPHRETIAILLEHDQPAPTIEAELDVIDVANKATKSTSPSPMGMVSRIWESSIQRTLAHSRSNTPAAIQRALVVYKKAINAGMMPTSQMALPILRALCPWFKPEKSDLRRAMSIYRHLVQAVPAGSHAESIDVQVFSTLLRSLVENRRYEDVKELCREIRQRKLALPVNQVSGHILSMIRSADSHDIAFDCYCHMRTLAPAEIDYVIPITAFINKSTDISLFPKALQVFEMITHGMEATTSKLNANVSITTLLNRYCQLIYDLSKTNPDLPATIRTHVDDINAYLRCEYPGALDGGLWNALLNAYNFTRDFRECFTLWDEMRSNHHSGIVDQTTVSIMLDACGQAGAATLATRIWEELRTERFPLNTKNWNTYVECLARFGASGHEEALRIVVDEMGESGSEDGTVPAAGLSTLRIILGQSWNIQRTTATIFLIRKKLPNLFEQMVSAALMKEDRALASPEGHRKLTHNQLYKALPKRELHPKIPQALDESHSQGISVAT